MILRAFLIALLLLTCEAHQKPFWVEDDSHDTSPQFTLSGTSGEPIMAEYAGITTFAHLPFVNCLNPTYVEEAKEKFDIAIIGAPFDTSVTYRPG
jgi:hypothetical protein